MVDATAWDQSSGCGSSRWVLLDCILPGETTWQIVLEADRQNIPVVLMTGDADQMKDITGGPRPFILKPFALHDLRSVIKEALRGRKSGQ